MRPLAWLVRGGLVAAVALATVVVSASRLAPPHRIGFLLDVARSPAECGDARNIVAVAAGGGHAYLIGGAPKSLGQIAAEVHDEMLYRAERTVYVTAEAGASWGDFVSLVDSMWPEARVVSVITPEVESLAQRSWCIEPSCGVCEKLRQSR